MLVRSGVIDEAAYLKLVAKTVNTVLRGSGRSKQSVAESSFDAWTKYYRQDENAPNAIVSYYTKGSLVALALDLTIRAGSGGRKSLDDVMRMLWQRYGRDFYAPDGSGGRGVTEAELAVVFDAASGLKLARTLKRYAEGTEDLPLAKLLAPFGVKWSDARANDKPSLSVRTVAAVADCKLANVYEDGAAHRAGLSAGDVLVALDGVRVTAANLDILLARYRIGDTVRLHAFRRDELMVFTVLLDADAAPQVTLSAPTTPAALVKKRAAWLKKALG
jgi:predicted metalloprotease with PDZ domain